MARLPILMYHYVTTDVTKSKSLTISVEQLSTHFKYLADNGYQTFHLSELEKMDEIPEKTVIITFDDVSVNQMLAVDLLKKYNLKATFFIPFSYVGKINLWGDGDIEIMTVKQLKQLPKNIELGHHSFLHRHYKNLSKQEINDDFKQCFSWIKKENLKVYPAIAFPYGGYPKKNKKQKQDFFTTLKENGMKMGLRIGNRPNNYPFKNPYEIKRIDVLGQDNLFRFKLKLKWGKLKLF